MAALSATLRSTFEREVIRARDTAEEAAQAALATLAVEQDRPFESMGEEKRALRRALRARAREAKGCSGGRASALRAAKTLSAMALS